MRPGKLWLLARSNLSRELGGLAVSAGGIALGIGCLVFFLALGRGLTAVVHDVFPASAREVEVVVPQLAFGSLLGETRLDESRLAQLRRIPGVDGAFPKMALRAPAVTRLNGPFFGHEIHMGLEVVGVGIGPELVAADLARPFVDAGEGKPIPIVLNRRFLELYNKVFAPQRGLPRLSEGMLIGFQLPIELGRSYVAGKTSPDAHPALLELYGFSDRATMAGVSLPLEAVRRENKRLGQDGDSYSSVLLRARDAKDVARIATAVKAMGLELDESERNRALQISEAVGLVTLALGLLASLITALAAVNIAQAFYASVRERKREIGVLRAVGATRADVAGVVLVEAAMTGLVGGLLGVVLARVTALVLDRLARTALPDFPFKPRTFFLFDWRYAVLGVGIAVAASLLGAFFPARAAAVLDPARALTET